MSEPIVIWGASGHAAVVADAIRCRGKYDIEGFLDDVAIERAGEVFEGGRVLGAAAVLPGLRARGVRHMVVAFGNCRARLACAEKAAVLGFDFPVIIHPSAIVAPDAQVGDGTVVMAGVVINADARIGRHCIINTCASVDHHNVLEDGVHVAPGARLAGRVSVGAASWIGIGTVIIDKIQIGCGALIGAGSLVLKDIGDYSVAWGHPAQVIRPTPDIRPAEASHE